MSRRTIEIAAFCAALLLVALIFHAWLAAHDDQLRLSATLATQKQALDAADARERDRTATLKDALAQIDALKRSAQTQTPVQLARALQDALHLPQPIYNRETSQRGVTSSAHPIANETIATALILTPTAFFQGTVQRARHNSARPCTSGPISRQPEAALEFKSRKSLKNPLSV